MKKSMRILSLLLAIAFSLSVCACSAADSFGGGYYGGAFEDDGLKNEMEAAPSDPSDSDSVTEDEESEENSKDEEIRLPAGMITAGAWVDNDNYQLWLDLFEQGEDAEGQSVTGKFNLFLDDKNDWHFNSLKRVKVTVKCGEELVAGATVIAHDAQGNVTFTAISDAQGKAYLFVSESEGSITVTSGEGSATAYFDAESRDVEVVLEAREEKRNVIEIMFVVDVTGSMGDEISFLKAELDDVIKKIAANDSETVIKLAFLFYRDLDDKVPFAEYGFCDTSDFSDFQAMLDILDDQHASGGGDTPEAVDEALMRAVNAQWSTGATTKLMYFVLDAPPHNLNTVKDKFNKAVLAAAEKGIRICPIICSGADIVTEYTMREAAIHTGGTFIFVTDDSGIGNPHYDPSLPNITVELLNSLIVRLTKGYHTGEFEDPIYWKEDPNLNQK